jgi:hypothetical protein
VAAALAAEGTIDAPETTRPARPRVIRVAANLARKVRRTVVAAYCVGRELPHLWRMVEVDWEFIEELSSCWSVRATPDARSKCSEGHF